MSILRDRILLLLGKLLNYLQYIYPLFFLIGTLAFFYLPAQDLCRSGHVYERALLADYHYNSYLRNNTANIKGFFSELSVFCSDSSDRDDVLIKLLHQEGFDAVRRHQWIDENDLAVGPHTNIYVIFRALRGDHTEAMLIGAPKSALDGSCSNNLGISMLLSLMSHLSKQLFWSKDIVILFSSRGSVGVHAWVDYYNGSRSHILKTINDSDVLFPARPLPLSGIIHMGFLLDLGDIVNIHETNVVVAHLVGMNGGMPCMDLFTIIFKTCLHAGNYLSTSAEFPNYVTDYSANLKHLLKFMTHQAFLPFQPGSHGPLMHYRIDSLTLSAAFFPRGPDASKSHNKFVDEYDLLEILENLLRSSSTSVEHLFQSFFFYLFATTAFYIPLSLYSPSVLGLIGGLVIFAVYLLLSWKDEASDVQKVDPSTAGATKGTASLWTFGSRRINSIFAATVLSAFSLLLSIIILLSLDIMLVRHFWIFVCSNTLTLTLFVACTLSLPRLAFHLSRNYLAKYACNYDFSFHLVKALLIMFHCSGLLLLFLLNFSLSFFFIVSTFIPLWLIKRPDSSRSLNIQSAVLLALNPLLIFAILSSLGIVDGPCYVKQMLTAHSYGNWFLWELVPLYWATLFNFQNLLYISYSANKKPHIE